MTGFMLQIIDTTVKQHCDMKIQFYAKEYPRVD